MATTLIALSMNHLTFKCSHLCINHVHYEKRIKRGSTKY